MSNKDPTKKPEGKQFLLLIKHPSCYTYIKVRVDNITRKKMKAGVGYVPTIMLQLVSAIMKPTFTHSTSFFFFFLRSERSISVPCLLCQQLYHHYIIHIRDLHSASRHLPSVTTSKVILYNAFLVLYICLPGHVIQFVDI